MAAPSPDQAPGEGKGDPLAELVPPDPDAKPEPDEKPKRTRRRATKKRGGRTAQPVIDIRAGMLELYSTIGMFMMLPFPDDAAIIINRAEQAADACAQLAEQSPAARRVLEVLCQGTAVGAVVGVHAAMIAGIAANHGMIDPQVVKLLVPEVANSGNGREPGGDTSGDGSPEGAAPSVAVVS